jgi:hypothetical protein
MSQCHHFIIANSTFSWWAAYLSNKEIISNKIVIAPENWYGEKWTEKWEDIYPDEWIKVKDYYNGYFEGSNELNTLNLEFKSWRDDIIINEDATFKRNLF